ncbi:MAG TPA: family 16 glycosylhydrolase, partial [Chryseolinea sp.]|nr:family 16 glycosylhydrolase [Chryseolinea sp.]
NGQLLGDQFHVYSIVWTPTEIKWYMDNVRYHVIDITPIGLTEFKKKFFFIFNVAVGGEWAGSPDNTTVFPQRMVVDYIRVFQ